MDVKHMTITDDGTTIEIPSTDELCRIIKTKFDDQEVIIEYLRDRIKEYESENYKDEYIAGLLRKIDKLESRFCFDFTDEEIADINLWQSKHLHRPGTVGGNFTYCFTPTSIGTIGTVKCTCGEEFTFRQLA